MIYNGKTIKISQHFIVFNKDKTIVLYDKSTQKSVFIPTLYWKVIKVSEELSCIEEVSQVTGLSAENIKRILDEGCIIGLFDEKSHIKKNSLAIYNLDMYIVVNNHVARVISFLITKFSIAHFLINLFLLTKELKMVQCSDIEVSLLFILIWIVLIWILSTIFHELGHIIIGKINGAFIAEVGYSNKGLPSLYTNLCGINSITNFSKRIEIFFAGIGVNMILFNIGYLFLLFLESIKHIALIIIFENALLIIINLCFIGKSDGKRIFDEIMIALRSKRG